MRVTLALTIAFCFGNGTSSAADFRQTTNVRFEEKIAPLLQAHCVRCHSPNIRKGELSLETMSDLNEQGYVTAGDPDGSYLIDLVVSQNGEPPAMPKEGEPLSASEVKLLKQWIEQGAHWPDDVLVREKSKADHTWWSLLPLKDSRPPILNDLPIDWRGNPIDQFVFAKLSEQGLLPNQHAHRRTLIRRVTYDLTGLPPTPAQIESFVHDNDPQAYEKLVNRLLASAHYGERWGRHWLDVVRFGESNGYERNVLISTLWPFRDYVIESLNEDKPFDQLIREHLAGDVLGPNDPSVEVGSAFLVAGPYDDVGNQDASQAAQIRANTIDEMIRATSGAFLGLTVGCARCHDHKFDPIRQTDYYSLYATFSGVRHGDRIVASPADQKARLQKTQPLLNRQTELGKDRDQLNQVILQRGLDALAEYETNWTRQAVNRLETSETFAPVKTRFVKLVSEGNDVNPRDSRNFRIDEFEIWTANTESENVALASQGAKASGPSRQIEDFPGAYGPHLTIDGKTGERFIATGGYLTIELAEPTMIEKLVFSSAREESTTEHSKFQFVGEYRIEISDDGKNWRELLNSHDRKPVSDAHRDHRLRQQEMTRAERKQLSEWARELNAVKRELAAIPPLPSIWVGQRNALDAEGPFHIFLGGSPQKKGEQVVPESLSTLSNVAPLYKLDPETPEHQRRIALADWIVHPDNPLTARVLANRLWHYHFGTGIVDTPSDFGYMGSQPTHPELLDWLAKQLHQHNWRLKPLHKLIVMSQTYRQTSEYREAAARIDGDSRLLWRFPPRRLSAEEVRDTILSVSGKLDTRMGGAGFRLYKHLQDNVSTYTPLDKHGPETYRRGVYHTNVRASVVDLMSEFDQPDCAFATPKRAETTTPLQALTMLNHEFTLDMAQAFARRLEAEAAADSTAHIQRAYALCYGREPTVQETAECQKLIDDYSLASLCRVLLNTSELIYVR